MNSMNIYWIAMHIQWNPLTSIEIHRKSIGNRMKSTGIHWNSSKVNWQSIRIILRIPWNSVKFHWIPMDIIETHRNSIEHLLKLNEINGNPLEIQVSGFCAGAESCGQGSTWVVARILDLSPERDECCCPFFWTSVSRLPGFLPLQLRLGGPATVLSAGPTARLNFIWIPLKPNATSNEHLLKLRWTFIGNPLDIHWKSIGNPMKWPSGIHWNRWK